MRPMRKKRKILKELLWLIKEAILAIAFFLILIFDFLLLAEILGVMGVK